MRQKIFAFSRNVSFAGNPSLDCSQFTPDFSELIIQDIQPAFLNFFCGNILNRFFCGFWRLILYLCLYYISVYTISLILYLCLYYISDTISLFILLCFFVTYFFTSYKGLFLWLQTVSLRQKKRWNLFNGMYSFFFREDINWYHFVKKQ